jgi:hypothetical protein
MAYSTITKPSLYFNTKLYTGDGSTSNSITGVGFQPDWIWIKKRNSSASHRLLDSIRGVQKHLASDNTDAEVTQNSVMSFDTDGFTVGDSAGTNGSSDTFASWNWLASGSTASNSDGSITSTVSANTTAGFSIVTFASGASGDATVGHGLGVAPNVIIAKARNGNSFNWSVYHSSASTTNNNKKYLRFNTTDALVTSGSNIWGASLPTSSVFGITNGQVVEASKNCVAYCFAEKTGYSKFGSYTGNGNADGPFIYTGFKPAYILIKNLTSGSTNWQIYDNKRDGFNPQNDLFRGNLTSAEAAVDPIDILSNGFKIRHTAASLNTSGNTLIYSAFAEEPLVANVGANGIPATAR